MRPGAPSWKRWAHSLCFLQHRHGRGDEAGGLAHVSRHDEGGARFGEVGISVQTLLGDLELHGFGAAGFLNGIGHDFQRVRGGVGHGLDGGGFALRIVDGRLLLPFRSRDEGLALAFGDVDGLLTRTFRGGDHGALFTLGGNLALHGVQDFVGRGEILDFVAQHLHAPGGGGIVERIHHAVIDELAFFEGLVEFELADHRAQRGLRQLGDGDDVVRRAIAGTHGVGHLEIQHAVHGELGVVFGDTDLAGHVERNFFQRVFVGHAVDEGNDDVQPRLQGGVVAAETLQNPGVLLWHDLDAAADEQHGDDGQDDGDFHERLPWVDQSGLRASARIMLCIRVERWHGLCGGQRFDQQHIAVLPGNAVRAGL